MNKNDIYDLKLGMLIYWKGKSVVIDSLMSSIQAGGFIIAFVNDSSFYSFNKIMGELSFEKQKPKVKRAQYLYKTKKNKKPMSTLSFYLNDDEFKQSIQTTSDRIEFMIRLTETEREFDE